MSPDEILAGLNEAQLEAVRAVSGPVAIVAGAGTGKTRVVSHRAAYAAATGATDERRMLLVTFTEILASELAGTGVQAQVVCPGVVRSEFHSRQGIDMSRVPRMQPEQIVTASLADLARGAVVSIPALPDEGTKVKLDEAASALLAVARTTALPPRYGTG